MPCFPERSADLAGFGLGGFADRGLAALVGVEVRARGGAIAVCGDGFDVDVVDWWREMLARG